MKIEEDHNEPEDRVYEEEDETASSSEEDEDSMKYINASHIDVRENDPPRIVPIRMITLSFCCTNMKYLIHFTITYYSIITTSSLQNITYITCI